MVTNVCQLHLLLTNFGEQCIKSSAHNQHSCVDGSCKASHSSLCAVLQASEDV